MIEYWVKLIVNVQIWTAPNKLQLRFDKKSRQISKCQLYIESIKRNVWCTYKVCFDLFDCDVFLTFLYFALVCIPEIKDEESVKRPGFLNGAK